MSNPVLEALGDTLVGKEGSVSTADALKGKSVLGLYFSAHWCPPCRGFTPVLSKKYTALKEAGKDFELVFVSSDRNQAAFDDYHKEMTFLAMPFPNRDGKEELSEMFEVSGIPSLIFVDAVTGELITDEGREAISSDKFIENYPYKPKPFDLMGSLGDTLKTKDGTVQTSEALKGKSVLGLYFSAHWCSPCRGFTPTLGQKYTALKDAGKNFELVFVSSDRDEKSFNDYHAEMPFMALPYANREGKAELSKAFGVSGIPALVFVDPTTGKVITDEGRGAISASTFIEDFPYHPKPVNDIGASVSGINDKKCLVLFMEDSSAEEQKALNETLTAIAVDELKKPDKEQYVNRFFVATDDGPIAQIRTNTKMPESKKKAEPREPQCLILHLAAGGKYVKSEGPVTADSIRKFVEDFGTKKLQMQQWGQ